MDTATTARARHLAGPVQGWVLVSAAWLAVMANQVLASVLPSMRDHFSGIEGVD
ncbi:MAG: hypothetical protein QM718_03615 [Steroidobacteraceae bacterium]